MTQRDPMNRKRRWEEFAQDALSGAFVEDPDCLPDGRRKRRSWAEFSHRDFHARANGLARAGEVSGLSRPPSSLWRVLAEDLLETLVELKEPKVAAEVAAQLSADPELRRQIEEARDRLIALIEEAKG
jgi:hypothetical protein